MEALEKITSAIGKKLEGRKPSLDRDDNLWDAAVLFAADKYAAGRKRTV